MNERLGGNVPEVANFDDVKYFGLQDPDGVTIEFFQGRSSYEKFLREKV